MKLAEILARQWDCWVAGLYDVRQDEDGRIWQAWDYGNVVDHAFIAEDRKDSIVTRDQWESERARIANNLQENEHLENPWQKAIDHELVMAHLGVAEWATEDQARAKLHELIDWHVSVATDPATNGGLVLLKPPSYEQELWDKVASKAYIGCIFGEKDHYLGDGEESLAKSDKELAKAACEYADAFIAERAKRIMEKQCA